MRAPRAWRRVLLLLLGLVAGLLLIPAIAQAQGIHPLPGQEFEESKPWTFYMSFLVALGAVGLVFLLGGSYVMLSRRFFGKDEIEPSKIRTPQLVGATAPRAMAPAPSAAPAAPAPPKVEPAAPPAPPVEKPAAEETPAEKPAAEAVAGEAPAAEATADEPPEERPAAPAPADRKSVV